MKHKDHEDHKEGMNHEDHEDHKEEERHKDEHEPLREQTEAIVRQVIGAGLAVHRALGPGFLEPVYDRALGIELGYRGLSIERQKPIVISYRGELVCRHRLDLVVEGAVVIEVKAVKKLRPIHAAQILSYLKASGCRVGLLMNFNVKMFVAGLQRFVR
jgi:GxxExxY protein